MILVRVFCTGFMTVVPAQSRPGPSKHTCLHIIIYLYIFFFKDFLFICKYKDSLQVRGPLWIQDLRRLDLGFLRNHSLSVII